MGAIIRSVLSSWRHSRIQHISDRLVEDARILLLIVERQQTSYDGALDGLVRDAFGSADRLRAAAAAAQECGRPTAEVDLLEQAAGRAEHLPPLQALRPQAGLPRRSWSGSGDEPQSVGDAQARGARLVVDSARAGRRNRRA